MSLPDTLLHTIPWNDQDESLWVASAFVLRRNLGNYLFPSKLAGPEMDQVLQTLKSNLEKNISGTHFISEKELTSTDRDLIIEHFLFQSGLTQSPNGAGMFIDERGSSLATINMGNHLEIRTLCFETGWENCYKQLSEIESELSKSLNFAFSPKFGYLTADPAHCGTGLTVSAYLHLPALIHTDKIQNALTKSHEEGITFMGLTGDLEELIGDIIVVQNIHCIGVSEDSILSAISKAATKLVGAEKTMRAHLKQESNTHIKDVIAKSFGLIRHSVQLETKEALDLLSLMKLGRALGYVSGVSDQKLSELFFKCRRGHLTKLFPELKEPEEISQRRADFVQEELKEITLSADLQ